MLRSNIRTVLLVSLIAIQIVSFGQSSTNLPQGFVYVDEIIPDIKVELRYAGKNNFIGKPVEGYEGKRCILTTEAALALKAIQEKLTPYGIGLKIFDGYRPQRAVNNFVRWAQDLGDTITKRQYYPNVKKSELFKRGYIAGKSGHSRGSTVDLTLVELSTGKELDMGSPFDFFDEKSHLLTNKINVQQMANRLLLNYAMTAGGFKPLREEWWHFTLKNEPFMNQYFDFIIR